MRFFSMQANSPEPPLFIQPGGQLQFCHKSRILFIILQKGSFEVKDDESLIRIFLVLEWTRVPIVTSLFLIVPAWAFSKMGPLRAGARSLSRRMNASEAKSI